ncbi:MAG: hypothetical protein MUP57_04830 [Clostridia bacterium]|nr:hypothetical protein [Clostridia bacterium]
MLFKTGRVPSQWAYSRFLATLFSLEQLLDEILLTLVKQYYELLNDFGKHLALDGKAISSHAWWKSNAFFSSRFLL